MLELFQSEFNRFRKFTALYAVANLLLLSLLQQLIDLSSGLPGIPFVMLVLYMLSGLGLALYQFSTYRKSGSWIWLMHRPLHRGRILAALALAATAIAALAVALPLFTVLATQAHYARLVVDWRHYAGSAYLAMSALSAWLAGGYIALHRSRWACAILLLPIPLTMHMATGSTVLALSLACNGLLLYLLYTVFRPSRYAGDDTGATLGSALPLQLCFYLALLWGSSVLFQTGLMVAGVHPRFGVNVMHGGYTEAMRAKPAEALLAGLESSTDPHAAAWRAYLTPQQDSPNGPAAGLYLVRQHTVPHALLGTDMTTLRDGENRWAFSHDRMMYRGVNARTRADLGWKDNGKGGPFESQPKLVPDFRGSAYLVSAHDLYGQPARSHEWRQLLHVDGNEQLFSGLAALGQRSLALTNQHLIILQGAARHDINLPLPVSNLARVDAAQVEDGTLVSFMYGAGQLDGVAAAPQIVMLVDDAGHARQVAQRELRHDFPLLFEHQDWWLSPVLHALVTLPDVLLDKGVPADTGASRFAPLLQARPAAAWGAALAAALLSAAGAAWWMRRTTLAPRLRAAWLLICLLLGMPALLSLMVLVARKPHAQAAGDQHAALATA